MKIVIDIDDNIYTRLFDNGVPIDLTTTINDTEAIATAIRNGTPLPEQQPCEDCVSRSKALEMLGDEPENWTDTEKEIQEVNDYGWFKSILESLPSVTPQQTCEEENLSRFCDDFCRYPREYDEEKEGEYMTEKVCSTCPLGRL